MSKRDSRHVQAQKAGKTRDRYTCQICGSTNAANGHHILDVQYGGSWHVNNIVTLCWTCHNKVHTGKIFTVTF